MEYVKGLTRKKLNNWKGKKWYHQRFDGAPYLLHMIAEAEIITDIAKKIGGNFLVHYCFFEDGKADWYIEMGDIERVYKVIIEAGKENPNISTSLMEKWAEQKKYFYDKCLEISQTNLDRLDDNDLIKLHDDYLEIILKHNSFSSLIDGFALGTDEMIANMIQKIYDSHDIKNEMRFSEVFSTLTAPIHLSFINEAEVDLLKTILKIKQGGDKNELLKIHQQKYFWIRNNYVDSYVVTVEDFAKEGDKILESKIDIAKRIENIEMTPHLNKEKKVRLIEKLELNDELRLLLRISEDFTHWQDERKKATFWTSHYAYSILSEISKRTGLSLDELKYLSPREVSNIFINKPQAKDLKLRRKECVAFWGMDGHEILNAEEYKNVKDSILGNDNLSAVDDFRGLTASMGKARGVVKVIQTAKQIDKVEEGDVLVAVMTRPDYVPAMKKASAVVTDEGGVTCHAAIVSRELGIPCIIGTKIATKILKDGMEVEVNANHSWVRIIK